MLSQEQYNNEMDVFLKELKSKYANHHKKNQIED
jgi:hypothetical protein